MRRLPVVLFTFFLALALAACGGGDDGEAVAEPSDDEPADDEPAEESSTTTTASTTTTTTEPARPPLPTLDPADIPDLVVAWENADGEPLELAQDLIGFPIPVPMPEGTAPWRIELDMNGRDPDDLWYWEWTYHATTDEPIPEIDIDLDDMGPGAIELRETYDPIMADLGWGYSNTTGSDPSSGEGGPQSVNHVYRSTAETIPVGEADATPQSLFVWADEELIFGEGVPGYQVDVDLRIEPGFIAAPIVRALLADVPVGDEDRLVDISLSSFERPADSFDAAEGLRYLAFSAEWELATDDTEARKETLPGDLDGIYQAGEESFFDPGFIEPAEPTSFDGDWQQPIVVLDRYEGSIEIADDTETGTATMTLEIRFEANREVLEPLPDE